MGPVSNPALKIHTPAPAATKPNTSAAALSEPLDTHCPESQLAQLLAFFKYILPAATDGPTAHLTVPASSLLHKRAQRAYSNRYNRHTQNQKCPSKPHLTEPVGFTSRPTGFHPASSSMYAQAHTISTNLGAHRLSRPHKYRGCPTAPGSFWNLEIFGRRTKYLKR